MPQVAVAIVPSSDCRKAKSASFDRRGGGFARFTEEPVNFLLKILNFSISGHFSELLLRSRASAATTALPDGDVALQN